MEPPDILSYLKMLSLYKEHTGCLETEIRSPFDGKCYPKESKIGTSIENLVKLMSGFEEPSIDIITEAMEKEIISSGFNVVDFIVKYIRQYDKIDSFLNYEKSDSPGYIFEFLWTLCIAFGIVDDKFPLNKYEILDINVNTRKVDKKLDLDKFLIQSVRSGNKGGYSDITLKQKAISEEKQKTIEKNVCDPNYQRVNSSYIFFTSKFYKKDKSASEKYDFAKIKSLFSIDNDEIYDSYCLKTEEGIAIPRIVILLNNKEDFLKSYENIRRSSKHLFKNFDENTDILDKSDLQYYYTKLRNMLDLFEYNPENIVRFLNKKYSGEKEILQPRLHQLMFVFKTIDCLSRDITKEVLWGAVARSGKTFIMGEFINFLNTSNTSEKDWRRCYDGKKEIPLLNKPREYPWTFIVFSPVINETKKQYTEELFDKYLEFDEFQTHDLQGKENVVHFIKTYRQQKQIIIISKQTVGKAVEGKENEYLNVILDTIKTKGGKVDGIFFDEHHMGGTSKISRDLLDSIRDTNPDIFMIFITATYNKSVFNFNIENDNIITWDYEDIIYCKDLTNPEKKQKMIDKTAHRLGEKSYFSEALECLNSDGFSDADIEREYRRYPNIFLLSNIWNELNVLKLFEKNGVQSFNMNSIFEVKEVDTIYEFKYPQIINTILDIIGGNPDEGYDYENPENINTWCYFTRMQNLCAIEGSRKVFSQLWFLPHGKSETRIKYVAENLKKLMKKHRIFKKYEILTTLDDEFDGKSYIKSREQKAFQENKDGLIILSGKKLSLGISLPCVDAVIMLNSIASPDLYYQMIFRALTESPGKKLGFIIDFNPERVLSTIYHQLFARGSKGKQDLREDAEDKFFGSEPLIYIDYDLILDKCIDSTAMIDLFKKFNITGSKYEFISMQDINNDIIREINQNLKLDADLIMQFNEMRFDELVIDSAGPKKLRHEVELGDENDATLQEIIEKFNIETAQIMENEGVKKKEAMKRANLKLTTDSGIEKTFAEAMKDRTRQLRATSSKLNFDLGYFLLPIIKISTFLTAKLKQDLSLYLTMVKMFEHKDNICNNCDEPIHSLMDAVRYYFKKTDIFKDERQLNLLISIIDPSNHNNILRSLDSISNIQGRRKDIIKNIENIQNLSEEVGIDSVDDAEFDSAIRERCKDGKCELIPNILDKKALLEYIEENLNPIKELKKGTGEVFTPWELVDEMLTTVPDEFWNNRNLKILEPGSGFGPFAIWVYYKLMRSLVEDFPNEENRRMHIIENMLYMAELNPVNVEICRNIFDPLEKYRLNLYCGDFLELNPEEEWGVGQFDLICGNPPYNPPKTETGSSGNTIWQHFVMKSFFMNSDKGFLLMVHPPGWKKPTEEIFDPIKLELQDGIYYRYNKKTGKKTFKQIRQGQVWQVLKENGCFHFIYTNDQKNKKIKEYLQNFPAVDYYLYQKGGDNKTLCRTKNIFSGSVIISNHVKINYDLLYLPVLITKETQEILDKITSKEGDKPHFKTGFDPRGFSKKDKGEIKYIYDASAKGPNYSFYSEKISNVDISKIVLNENGGIKSFYCKYIDKDDNIGVLHHTLFFPIHKDKGQHIEKFLNSDIVKFIFLITQYSSGKMTTNEKLVANSITIPPEGVEDYYQFFGIEKYRDFIITLLGDKQSERKDKLPKVVKNTHLSFGQSAEQPEEALEDYEDEKDNEDDDVTEDEQEFDEDLALSGEAVDAHYEPDQSQQPDEDVCDDTGQPIIRVLNTSNEFYTENVCGTTYIFLSEEQQTPSGYLNYGKPFFFPEGLIAHYESCAQHQNKELCVNDCNWIVGRLYPSRCILNKERVSLANISDYNKYNRYRSKSLRPAKKGGKSYKKTRRNKK